MHRLIAVIAVFLATPTVAAQEEQNSPAAPAIESIGVLYDVDAPFGQRGLSLSVVRREGAGYTYETYSRGRGLARLVIASDALESTRFEIDEQGLVQPQEYLCRSCDGSKDGLVNITYDWTGLSAQFTEGGEQTQFGLEPKAMDRKAWEIQTMMYLAQKQPLDTQPTLEGGKLKLYDGELLGEETLSTGAGELQTIKYRRQREGSDNFQYIWYAQELGWLPARWEIWRKDKRIIIIEAYEYSWGEQAALAMRQDWLDR